MVTNSTSKTPSRRRTGTAAGRSSQTPRSRADQPSGSTGAFIGAAVAGAAIAVAANLGRKLAVQGMSARKGSWAESLAAEHQMVLALFDKALATDEADRKRRALLLMQIGHALDKHAYAEEHVVYPALREANNQSDAEQLETEHGEVKTYLYRLHNTEVTSPIWISIMRDFRNSVAAHARLEEEVIFPRLRSEIDDELDEKITSDVNKAGFMMA